MSLNHIAIHLGARNNTATQTILCYKVMMINVSEYKSSLSFNIECLILAAVYTLCFLLYRGIVLFYFVMLYFYTMDQSVA